MYINWFIFNWFSMSTESTLVAFVAWISCNITNYSILVHFVELIKICYFWPYLRRLISPALSAKSLAVLLKMSAACTSASETITFYHKNISTNCNSQFVSQFTFGEHRSWTASQCDGVIVLTFFAQIYGLLCAVVTNVCIFYIIITHRGGRTRWRTSFRQCASMCVGFLAREMRK